MSLETEFLQQHYADIVGRNIQIESILSKTAKDLTAQIALHHYPAENLNAVMLRQIDLVLDKLHQDITTNIQSAVVNEWNLANDKNNHLTDSYLGKSVIDSRVLSSLHQLNIPAMNSFLDRTENGLNLSERVWNLTETSKDMLKNYLASGVVTGKDSGGISRDIRDILNEPNRLYRRVRDEKGNLVLSESAKQFHPGQGVYRSSYKNAMRLSRTEMNMAYTASDFTRRQQLPFILGIEIKLSGSHRIPDICDELKGEYPTGFVFNGWHPQCLCYTTSDLMPKEDFLKYLDEGFPTAGGEYTSSLPVGALNFINLNREKLARAEPYWIRDNFTSAMKVAPEWDKIIEDIQLQLESKSLNASARQILETKLMVAKQQVGVSIMPVLFTPTTKEVNAIINAPDISKVRGHLLGKTWIKDTDFILQDIVDNTGVSLAEAKEMVTAIRDYTYNSYILVRGIQQEGVAQLSTHLDIKKLDVLTKYGTSIEKYIKLMPKFNASVYRGIDASLVDFKKLKSGDIIDMKGTSSWTSKDTLPIYLKRNVHFIIKNPKTGVSIRQLTKFPEENEVLFSKDAKFQIIDTKIRGKSIDVLLEEVVPGSSIKVLPEKVLLGIEDKSLKISISQALEKVDAVRATDIIKNTLSELRSKYVALSDLPPLGKITVKPYDMKHGGSYNIVTKNITLYYTKDAEAVMSGTGYFNSTQGFAGNLRHEFAHHFWESKLEGTDTGREWSLMAGKNIKTSVRDISRYAGESGMDEMFAEAFSAYTSSVYIKGTLPKIYEDFLEKVLTGKETKIINKIPIVPGKGQQKTFFMLSHDERVAKAKEGYHRPANETADQRKAEAIEKGFVGPTMVHMEDVFGRHPIDIIHITNPVAREYIEKNKISPKIIKSFSKAKIAEGKKILKGSVLIEFKTIKEDTPFKYDTKGNVANQLSIKPDAVVKKHLIEKTYNLPLVVVVKDTRTGQWYFRKEVNGDLGEWRLNSMTKCTEEQARRWIYDL